MKKRGKNSVKFSKWSASLIAFLAFFVLVVAPTAYYLYTSGGEAVFLNRTEITSFGMRPFAPVLFMDFNSPPESNTVNPYGFTYVKDNSIFNNFGAKTDTHPWNPAKVGNGLGFDGSNDYFSTAQNNSLSFNTSNFTISFWLLPRSFSSEMALYDSLLIGGAGSRDNAFVLVQTASTGKLRFFTRSAYSSSTTNGLNLGAWNHITLLKNSTTIYFYINGVLDSTNMAFITNVTNAGIVIGRYSDSAAGYYNGSIDEAMIFNRSLSQAEITSLYNNQSQGQRNSGLENDASLVSYYKLDELSGTSASDSLGINNGTLNGYATDTSPAWNSTGGYDGNGAYVFDGVNDKMAISNSNYLDLRNQVSLCAWINRNSAIAYGTPLMKPALASWSSPYQQYGLQYSSTSDDIYFAVSDLAGNSPDVAATTLGNNVWFFVCGVYNGTTASIYINGTYKNSVGGFTGGLYSTSQPIYLGTSTGSDYLFNGSIDQVQIFNRSLSAAEVLCLYNGTGCGGVNNSNYIGKYANGGNFNSLVFFNQNISLWSVNLSTADATNRTGIVHNKNEINLSNANLVGYWPLDTNYLDATRRNNGTCTGNSCPNNATGLTAGAMGFDGVDDYVLVGDGTFLDSGMTNFTISAWLYLKSSSARQFFIDKTSTGNPYPLELEMNGSNIISWTSGIAPGHNTLVANTSLSNNTWSHIVFVGTSNSKTIYLNGILIASNANAGSIVADSSRDFWLGRRSDSTLPFNGTMDEVSLYNISLNASQIQQLYKSGLSQHANANITLQTRTANNYNISDPSLVGFWGLNNDSSIGENATLFVDSRGIKNLTCSGAACPTLNLSGVVGNSYYWGGNSYYLEATGGAVAPSAVTISAWIYHTQNSGYETIVTKRDASYTNYEIGSSVTNHKLYFYSGGSVGESSYVIPLNTWVHATVTANSTGSYFYVNGNYIGSTAVAIGNSAANTLTFGNIYARNQGYYGLIDEVRIYNRSLSANEVLDLYNLGSTHINWTNGGNYSAETIVNDGIGINSPTTGKFMQYETNFYTNDTNVVPYLISQNVTNTTVVVNITILSPQNNFNYSTNITGLNLTVTATMGVSACWFSNNSGTNNYSVIANCSSNFTNLVTIQGRNNWTVYANDTTGLLTSTNLSFLVDYTNPNATLISPGNSTIGNTSAQNYTVNATDNLGVKNATLSIYNSTNALVNTTTFNFSAGVTQSTIGIVVSLADGIYNWFYRIFDWSGNNLSTTNRTITLDATNPKLVINSPIPAFNSSSATLSVNFTVNETNIATCLSSKNGQANVSRACVSGTPFVFSDTYSEGINNITIYVNDTAGNKNSTSVTFYVDTIFPQISFGVNTELNNSNKSQNYIYANISLNETNPKNLTFALYNSSRVLITNSTLAFFNVTGGNITYDGAYTVHTFTTNGTFNISGNVTAEVLIVAGGGGGGGGGAPGGGGGAGGLIYNSSYVVAAGNYNVVVGSGGTMSNSGSNSSFSTYTAVGGGAGYSYSPSTAAKVGGSGGGGGYSNAVGAAGIAGQGNAGGNGHGAVNPVESGGGGGAGTVGATYTPGQSGNGGNGLNYSINGTNIYYAGGGGGTATDQGALKGIGGLGGGGNGSNAGSSPGINGTANTGGGGGGAHGGVGGTGGSGVVIIRYLTSAANLRAINWTNLSDGVYYYNVSVYDYAGNNNFTETRKITLDDTFPNATLLTPTNATYSNTSNNNLTANLTDNLGIANATLNIYNSTSLVNQTVINYSAGTVQTVVGIVVTLADNVYSWFYNLFDFAGNQYTTTNNTVTVDTTYPKISFNAATFQNNSNVSQNYIYANISLNETNPKNITYALYNSSRVLVASVVPNLTVFNATGGSITYDGAYTIHTFTTNGTFNISSGVTAEVLVIGGGGAGGAAHGGGGGAGGLIYNSSYSISSGTYSIVVGSGAPKRGGDGRGQGYSGASSSFNNLIALGGGGGGSQQDQTGGANGGSGGGGSRTTGGIRAGGSGTAGQGNNGGTGSGDPWSGAGGGGAGAVGGSGTAGIGGAGLTYNISGTNVCYAGGGGGAPASTGIGGSATCGGTRGMGDSFGTDDATPNTGGGSGGCRDNTGYGCTAGAGGSGIVIIKYLSSGANSRSVNFTNLSDGSYYYNVSTYDYAGNYNQTETRKINLDTTKPRLAFGINTELNNSNKSQNYVYVNVSLTEINLNNITYAIYNSSFSNITTYLSNSSTNINWTNLANGVYYYNVSVYDYAGNYNQTETRKITLDTYAPAISLIAPANASMSPNYSINFSANVTDNLGIKNITLKIYNQSTLVNQTNFNFGEGITQIINAPIVYLLDGSYTWFYDAFDWAGNRFTTANQTLTVDAPPNATLSSPENASYSTNSTTTFVANLTDAGSGIANATLYVYNQTGLVNQTTVTSGTHYEYTYEPALHLNGVDNRIFFNAGTFSNQFYTISAWFKYDGISSDWDSIFSTGGIRLGMFLKSDGKICHRHWPGGSEDDCTSYSLEKGKWYFAAITRGEDYQAKLYVNGILETQQTVDSLQFADWAGNTYIGGDGYYGTHFNGSIDDVMIFNRALSQDEITAIYLNQSVGQTNSGLENDANLVSYYKLNETSGSVAYDSMGVNNGAVEGSPDWTANSRLINSTATPENFVVGTLTSTISIPVILADNVYSWFVDVFDWAGNLFQTDNRTVIVDTTLPMINLTLPENNLQTSTNVQNLSANLSDNVGLKNATLRVYDSNGAIYSTTNFKNGSSGIIGSSLTSGLVAYYPFDNDVNDYSNYARVGTNNGAISDSGKIGGSYLFAGAGNYVSYTDVGLPDGDLPRSYSGWIKLTNADYTDSVGILFYGIHDWWYKSSDLLLTPWSGTYSLDWPPWGGSIVAGGHIHDTQWHHVAMTYNGGSPVFYIDGNNVGIVYDDTWGAKNTVLSGQLYLGFWPSLGNANSGIYLDELGMWNRSLSSEEVATLYNNQTGMSLVDSGSSFDEGAQNTNLTKELTFVDGIYNWSYQAVDLAGNINVSENRTLTIDTTAPKFSNIIYTPNSTALLDPQTTLTFYANVSDALVGVNKTILQIYNGTLWQNVSMNLNAGLYEANFTLNQNNANYTFNIWANDSVGNINVSSNYTFSANWDCTWNISTNTLEEKAGFFEEKSLGNLTITNTGDYNYSGHCTVKFTPNYNSFSDTYYRSSFATVIRLGFSTNSFTLSAGQNYILEVTGGFPSSEEILTETPIVSVSSNISDTFDNKNITYVNATMIVVKGVVLYQDLVYPTTNINVDLIAQNLSWSAYVRNLGADGTENNTAYNVSDYWTIDSAQLVGMLSSGNLTEVHENLSTTEKQYNNLIFSLTKSSLESSSPEINKPLKVIFSSSGYRNDSGNLSLIDNGNNRTTLSHSFNVTFLCSNEINDTICPSTCSYPADMDCSPPQTTTTIGGGAGGGGGGGGGGGALSEKSDATFELLSGKEQEFTLRIDNKLSNDKRNINVSVSGINQEYLSFAKSIKLIPAGSYVELKVKITAPAYFTQGKYVLKFNFAGDIMGNTTTKYTETKTVTLYITELTRATADNMLNQSFDFITQMNESGMILKDVENYLAQMNSSYNDVNFLTVRENFNKLKQIYTAAFEAKKLIEEMNKSIAEAEYNGIDVLRTKKLFYTALVIYQRGDYLLALSKLQETRSSYLYEAKGEYNILVQIKNNPLQSFGIFLLISGAGVVLTLATKYRIYKNRIKLLGEEEQLLLQLMKTVQRECFERNRMSMEEYEEAMIQYERKLAEAIEDRIKTETRLANLFNLKGKSVALQQEKERLITLMRVLQNDYLVKGKVETRIYDNMMKTYTTRLSKVEEELVFIEANEAIKGAKK